MRELEPDSAFNFCLLDSLQCFLLMRLEADRAQVVGLAWGGGDSGGGGDGVGLQQLTQPGGVCFVAVGGVLAEHIITSIHCYSDVVLAFHLDLGLLVSRVGLVFVLLKLDALVEPLLEFVQPTPRRLEVPLRRKLQRLRLDQLVELPPRRQRLFPLEPVLQALLHVRVLGLAAALTLFGVAAEVFFAGRAGYGQLQVGAFFLEDPVETADDGEGLVAKVLTGGGVHALEEKQRLIQFLHSARDIAVHPQQQKLCMRHLASRKRSSGSTLNFSHMRRCTSRRTTTPLLSMQFLNSSIICDISSCRLLLACLYFARLFVSTSTSFSLEMLLFITSRSQKSWPSPFSSQQAFSQRQYTRRKLAQRTPRMRSRTLKDLSSMSTPMRQQYFQFFISSAIIGCSRLVKCSLLESLEGWPSKQIMNSLQSQVPSRPFSVQIYSELSSSMQTLPFTITSESGIDCSTRRASTAEQYDPQKMQAVFSPCWSSLVLNIFIFSIFPYWLKKESRSLWSNENELGIATRKMPTRFEIYRIFQRTWPELSSLYFSSCLTSFRTLSALERSSTATASSSLWSFSGALPYFLRCLGGLSGHGRTEVVFAIGLVAVPGLNLHLKMKLQVDCATHKKRITKINLSEGATLACQDCHGEGPDPIPFPKFAQQVQMRMAATSEGREMAGHITKVIQQLFQKARTQAIAQIQKAERRLIAFIAHPQIFKHLGAPTEEAMARVLGLESGPSDQHSIKTVINSLLQKQNYIEAEEFAHHLNVVNQVLRLTKERWISKKAALFDVCPDPLLGLQAALNQKKKKKKQHYALQFKKKGDQLYEKKEYQEAKKEYSLAIQMDQQLASAYNRRGNCEHMLGDFQAALNDFNSAVKCNPELAIAYFNKGNTLRKMKQFKESIVQFKLSIEKSPLHADSLVNMGVSHKNLKEFEKAIECYDRALSLQPLDHVCYYNKGLCLVKLSKFEEALKCFERAYEEEPSVRYAQQIVELLRQQHRQEEAEAWAKKIA